MEICKIFQTIFSLLFYSSIFVGFFLTTWYFTSCGSKQKFFSIYRLQVCLVTQFLCGLVIFYVPKKLNAVLLAFFLWVEFVGIRSDIGGGVDKITPTPVKNSLELY